jgi:hypothetical protein
MNFGGDEIYFKQEPALSGKTFGEALLAFEDSAVMGMRKTTERSLMSPPMDSASCPAIRSSRLPKMTTRSTLPHAWLRSDERADPLEPTTAKPKPEKCLILGWNRSGTTIVRELDNYVPKVRR